MALISCPECGHQISDTAPACPQCGYVMKASEPAHDVTPVVISHRSTKIGKFDSSSGDGVSMMGFGVILLVLSMIFILCSSYGFEWLILFFVCFIPGIFLVVVGQRRNKKCAKVVCPYCGKAGLLVIDTPSYFCPACKKNSVLNGDQLFTVE